MTASHRTSRLSMYDLMCEDVGHSTLFGELVLVLSVGVTTGAACGAPLGVRAGAEARWRALSALSRLAARGAQPGGNCELA